MILDKIMQELEEAGLEALAVETVPVVNYVPGQPLNKVRPLTAWQRHFVSLKDGFHVKVLQEIGQEEVSISVCRCETVSESVKYKWLNWPVDWPDGDLSLLMCGDGCYDTEVGLGDWPKLLKCLRRMLV